MENIREFDICDHKANAKKGFKNNIVHTNKFTPLNFVPLFLLDKFRKFSNMFFLACAILEQTGDYTPPGMLPSYVPMSVVYSFSALKDVYEEIKRRISDNSINNSDAWVLKNGTFVQTTWGKVKVGDVLRVETNQLFPADLILIGSSEPEGLAYIETANLDGESNLKLRMAPTSICTKFHDPESVQNGISGKVKCELPNANLYKFEGSMILDNQAVSLDHNNLLPRGATLRNATWIMGVVVYTGHESRIMMNASKDPVKTTKFEYQVNNHLIYYVAAYLVIIAIINIFNLYTRKFEVDKHWYLNPKKILDENTFVHYLILFVILFSTMIPISLFVTVEFVRLFLGFFIASDLKMYDSETDTPARANSSNLIEELGQIEYVLTDKTGTLTCNEMVMKHLIIDGRAYLNCTDTQSSLKDALAASESLDPAIDRFLQILGTCHTVMIDKSSQDPQSRYQASSPDELAMVNAAASLGYIFEDRSTGTLSLRVGEQNLQFGVCAIIEFTSSRKRMSVLVHDAAGKYYLFIKGADNVILERLMRNSDDSLEALQLNNSMKHLEKFASEGLRTLCFAYKEIDAEVAVSWLEKWNVALNTVNDRQRVIDEVAAEIETDLVFIGATGVEDRLQESVADTIHSLYKANINIWMLTGDRFETAVSAGFLSGLIDAQTKQLHVLIPEYNEIIKTLQFYENLTSESDADTKFALVINGASITIIFSELFTETDLALFMRVVKRCRTLLCCRLSPLQKAQITEFVRFKLKKIALAIGDGGNDVSMIQAANIGVGISGKEGLQASRSADFSIAKFKYLKRLLLVHGAWAIYRVSRMVLYALYKNILIYLFNFWYSGFNLFSGATLVDGFALSDWNLLYTCWGPTVIGMTDQFVCEEELMRHPQLYRFGQRGTFISHKAFWASAFNSFCQSALIFAAVYVMFNNSLLPEGHTASIYYIGNLAFGALLFVAILKSFLMMNYMNNLMMMAVVVGGGFWYMRILFNHHYHFLRDESVFVSFKSLVLWSSIALLTTLALTRDFLWKFYLRQYRPLPYHIVQEFQITSPVLAKKSITESGNQVYSGHSAKPRKSRGFSFSQSAGQYKVLEAYRQSPKLKPVTRLGE